MTVYFENNTYKYETEAVLKLFCPLESFEFEYDKPAPDEGDRIVVSVSDKLYILACLHGKTCERSLPRKASMRYPCAGCFTRRFPKSRE